MNFQISKMRPLLGMATLAVVASILFAGCGGGGSSLTNGCLGGYGGGGGNGGTGGGTCNGNPNPGPTTDSSAQGVTMFLTGENPVTVNPYGQVKGYQPGTSVSTPSGSNVIHLTANMPVQFTNREATGSGIIHTASSLGAWSGSYPGSGPSGSALTASSAGTSISAQNFSTGAVNPGQNSQVYTSGGPAMTVLGCYYDWPVAMRTVVIVQ